MVISHNWLGFKNVNIDKKIKWKFLTEMLPEDAPIRNICGGAVPEFTNRKKKLPNLECQENFLEFVEHFRNKGVI